jgi:acetyl-CoA carboxylase carboxyltransferase component
MTFVDKVNDLQSKKQKLELGGGQERIDQQHKKGKLTARERISKLFDEGSFVEVGTFAETHCIEFDIQKKKAPGDGVVTGYGTINGRPVFAAAQDFTVIGGSLGAMHAKKIVNVMNMAAKTGAPFIALNDSGGARIEEGVEALGGYGDIFKMNTMLSGVVPQITVILGPCAGGASYSPALSDFVFMVENISQMFITGPEVIKATTGEEVTMEDLGGASAHASKSGNAHRKFASEDECFEGIRKLLSYLPDNNLSGLPAYECTDDLNRTAPEIYDLIPDGKSGYDVKSVIRSIVDNGDFFEIHPDYAQNVVTCFARINGKTVGIVANQPIVKAGCLDINASDKAARFVRFCDSFNVPLVTLTDVPGYLPGKDQEHNGIIRHGAKLLYAFSEATVPKVNVIIGKAYGGAYIAMNSKHLGADVVYAWPSAEIAVMGPDGAANIIFRNEIKNSDDPIRTRQEKIAEYTDKVTNPYVAASKGFVDDIIDPAATRQYVAAALEMLASKSESRPKKKHGNIPL